MARKSPSKPVKKPVPSPSPEALTRSPGSTDGKDTELAQLLREAEEVQGATVKPEGSEKPAPAAEQPVPEVYRRIVYPLSLGFSMAADWGFRRSINCAFVPITKDQAALFEEDAAYCIKEAVDGFMPQFAKDHPRMTALVLTLGTVCMSNIRKIQPNEPVGSTGADVKKTGAPVTGSPIPSEHEVRIETADGTIGQGGIVQ